MIKARVLMVSVMAMGMMTLSGCGRDTSFDSLDGFGLGGGRDDRQAGRHGENESSDDHGRGRHSDDDDDSDRQDRNRIQSPGDQIAARGSTVDLLIKKTRSGDDDVYSFSAVGLPQGLAIDPVSGRISGVVSASAITSQVTVTAMKRSGSGTHMDLYSVKFAWVVTE